MSPSASSNCDRTKRHKSETIYVPLAAINPAATNRTHAKQKNQPYSSRTNQVIIIIV
jgi:hypothetical protein